MRLVLNRRPVLAALVALLLVPCAAGCGGAQTASEPVSAETAETPAPENPTPPRKSKAEPLVDACKEQLDQAGALQKSSGLDAAASALEQAWAVCGDGRGVLEKQAQIALEQGNAKAAAEFLYREISEPPASEFAFELLGKAFSKLPADARKRLAALGAGPDTALAAPSPRAQVLWVTHVVCRGEEPENYGQGTMEYSGQQLELLVFDCADGKEHEVYFVTPPDPLQQMFEQRLGSP